MKASNNFMRFKWNFAANKRREMLMVIGLSVVFQSLLINFIFIALITQISISRAIYFIEKINLTSKSNL